MVEIKIRKSFAFDIDSGEFMGNQSSLGNGHEWHRTMPVKILCINDINNETYTIQVLGRETDAKVMATFECEQTLDPHINFSGKVTVSDVFYAH